MSDPPNPANETSSPTVTHTVLDQLHWLRVEVPPLPGWPARSTPVYFEVHGCNRPPVADANVQILTHLLPAMRIGRSLEAPADASVDPELCRQLPRAIEILSLWYPQLRTIPVGDAPPTSASADRQSIGATSGTGCFFTGGADSFRTLQRHLGRIDTLVFVFGYDVTEHQPKLVEDMLTMLRDVAAETGKRLILVRTNLRQLTDPVLDWGGAHGAALAAVARLLKDEFAEVMLASSFAHGALIPWGSHPKLDPCWSTDRIAFLHDGADENRWQKLLPLLEWPLAMKHLRVCTWNTGDTYNCGRCSKCLRTRAALNLIDGEQRVRTLPPRLDLSELEQLELRSVAEVPFIEEMIDEARRRGRDKAELGRMLESALERADLSPDLPPRHLGNLPPSPLSVSLHGWEPASDHVSFELELRWRERREFARIRLSGSARFLPQPEDIGDAALCWLLPLASLLGVPLRLDHSLPVDEELLARLRHSLPALVQIPPLNNARVVEIRAQTRPRIIPDRLQERIGCAFSGGIDACALAHRIDPAPDILLYVHGIDAATQGEQRRARVEQRVGEAATATAPHAAMMFLDTNLRQVLTEGFGLPWDITFRSAIHGAGHLLSRHVNGFAMASDDGLETMSLGKPLVADHQPMIFEAFTSSRLRHIYWDEGESRQERIASISASARILKSVWVCQEEAKELYHESQANCGSCEKCLRTAVALILAGKSPAHMDFATPFHLSHIDEIAPLPQLRFQYWKDMLEPLQGRSDLDDVRAAVERLVERSKKKLSEATLSDSQLAALRKHPAYPRWLKRHGHRFASAVFSHKPTRWMLQWIADSRAGKRFRLKVMDRLLERDPDRILRRVKRARWRRRLGLNP